MHVLMLLQFHCVTLNTSSLWFALDFTYSLDASRAFLFSSAKSLSSWEGCLFTANIQVPPQSHAWACLDASSDTKLDPNIFSCTAQVSNFHSCSGSKCWTEPPNAARENATPATSTRAVRPKKVTALLLHLLPAAVELRHGDHTKYSITSAQPAHILMGCNSLLACFHVYRSLFPPRFHLLNHTCCYQVKLLAILMWLVSCLPVLACFNDRVSSKWQTI